MRLKKKTLLSVCLIATAVALGCGKNNTTTPSPVADSAANANPDGSTLKIGAPSLDSPANGFTYQGIFDQQTVNLSIGNLTGKYATFPVTFEIEVRNGAGALVSNPKVGASNGVATATTIPNTVLSGDATYSWRARATYNGAVGPWSPTRTFRTAIAAGCFGQTCIDPLTIGRTFGIQRGGHFVAGGWQADNRGDGIDYDIPTLTEGTVEFDITNIGQQEGQCCNADLKLLSMGNVPDFGSFDQFRDGPWKMHLVQRADNDGLEIVWRDSTDNGTNYNDHRIKMPCCGPKFRNDIVNHFVVKWDEGGYEISSSTNGGPLVTYLSAPGDTDGFFKAYAPPKHRISLGCYPRGETIVGSTYRNVVIRPGS